MNSRPLSIWNALVRSVILLSLLAVACAGLQDFSLNPDPLTECETLTVQWQGDGPAAIAIVEQGQHPAQTLLQATLTAPTRSLEWVINATGGAQLGIAVSAQVQSVGIEMDLRRVVEPGTPTCFSSVCCVPHVRTPHSQISADPRSSWPEHPQSTSMLAPSPSSPSSTRPDSRSASSTASQLFSARSSSQLTAPVTMTSNLSPSMPPTTFLDSATSSPVAVASNSNFSSPSMPARTFADQARSGLDPGAVAGIATGVGVAIVSLVFVSYSCIKRRKSRGLSSTSCAKAFVCSYPSLSALGLVSRLTRDVPVICPQLIVLHKPPFRTAVCFLPM